MKKSIAGDMTVLYEIFYNVNKYINDDIIKNR